MCPIRVRDWLVVSLPVLVALSSGAPARAAERQPDGWLTWVREAGAESCPSAAEFEDKVARQLGKSPATVSEEARRTIAVRIWARRGASDGRWLWRAEEQVLDANRGVVGHRALSKASETCGPIADALALVTAMVVGGLPSAGPPSEVQDQAGGQQPPTPSADPVQAPAAKAEAPPPAAAEKAEGLPPVVASQAVGDATGSLEAGLSAQMGMLPNWAGELRAAVSPPAWPSLFATFAYAPEGRAVSSSNRGADLRLWTTGVGLCPANLRASERRIGLCVGLRTGQLHASGYNLDYPKAVDRWLFDLTLALHVEQPVTEHVFLDLSVHAAVPLLRPRIAYRDADGVVGEVFRPWPVVPACHLGAGFRFGS